MANSPRIGVFGGTFDPLHNAHVRIAHAALKELHLDRVLFVVAARPPHKSVGPHATPEERLAMVHAGVANESHMEACALELDRDGPSYTRDTLVELQQMHPETKLFLILGFDSVLDLPRWKNPDGILALAELAVVGRPGLSDDIPAQLAASCTVLPFEQTDVSSTRIRQRIIEGEAYHDMLPSPTAALIHQKGLYEASLNVRQSPRASEFISLLAEGMKPRTRKHSLSTAEYMRFLAEKVSISEEQAITTGLLHDWAKRMSKKQLLATAQSHGIVPNDAQRQVPGLLHGPIAAAECQRILGIEDKAIIEAIRWHTTGKPELSPLGLALYVADFAEPTRTFPEAAEARKMVEERGFAEALRYVTEKKIIRLRHKHTVVDPMTEAFYEWFCKSQWAKA